MPPITKIAGRTRADVRAGRPVAVCSNSTRTVAVNCAPMRAQSSLVPGQRGAAVCLGGAEALSCRVLTNRTRLPVARWERQ